MDPRFREDDDGIPMQENLENSGLGGQPPRQPLEKNQKIALAALSVIAVFFVVMWVVQLNKKINDPFNAGDDTPLDIAPVEDADSDAVLKAKDTDKDGLNDWDELNVYKTSPYLEDSDSDTFSDGEEVAKGTDPNCPAGRVCSATDPLENTSATSSASGTQGNGSLEGLLDRIGAASGATSGQTDDAKNILSGKTDASALRKALIDAGMDKRILDALTDEDILESYEQTLGQAQQ